MRAIGLNLILILLFVTSARGAERAETPTPLRSEFGQRLFEALEFIDYPDVLVAIVSGNSSPWTRYDAGERAGGRESTLYSRWHGAVEWARSPAFASLAPRQQLRGLHERFAEGVDLPFRGTPIDDAGGDFEGFDRVSLAEHAALTKNPLLLVTSKPDAERADHRLIRYAYPSAANFENFSSRLTPEVLAGAREAKRSYAPEWNYTTEDYKFARGGANPKFCDERPHFCAVTRSIIGGLIDGYAGAPRLTPTARFQRLMSIHPFDDYNGRTLRAWYRSVSERPLFLTNNYCDLYCDARTFAKAVRAGERQLARIETALSREEIRSPGYPDFYALPDFWWVATESAGIATETAATAATARAYFGEVPVKQSIDHKKFADVFAGLGARIGTPDARRSSH